VTLTIVADSKYSPALFMSCSRGLPWTRGGLVCDPDSPLDNDLITDLFSAPERLSGRFCAQTFGWRVGQD
jgi:hypothetical protein